MPVYKVSRKKWYSTEKEGLKSNYTLDRGDWAIARSLECDAWRDICKMAHADRAEIAEKSKAKSSDTMAESEVE